MNLFGGIEIAQVIWYIVYDSHLSGELLVFMDKDHIMTIMSGISQNRQLNLLSEARQLREAVGESGYHADSTSILEAVREDRLDDLADLR